MCTGENTLGASRHLHRDIRKAISRSVWCGCLSNITQLEQLLETLCMFAKIVQVGKPFYDPRG